MVKKEKIIALLTDFGLYDHFVGTMKGVILKVDPGIRIFDISHSIQPQNILEAAYTLSDSLPYWPEETIIAAVVDPGVGTGRKSVAVRTKSRHIIVCPDNGLLSLINVNPGIAEIIVIDEHQSRLPGSNLFYTFHGRDIYAYNAARLASGSMVMKDLGISYDGTLELLPEHCSKVTQEGNISGHIVKIEKPFGNLVTNVNEKLLSAIGIRYGDILHYHIAEENSKRLEGELPFVKTFGEVIQHQALAYIDSSGRLGFAVNMGDFSDYFQVNAGLKWHVEIRKQ